MAATLAYVLRRKYYRQEYTCNKRIKSCFVDQTFLELLRSTLNRYRYWGCGISLSHDRIYPQF